MRDTTKGILIGMGVALAASALALLGWRYAAQQGQVLTDGAKVRVPASLASPREVLWEPADLLPEWINQGDQNYEPRLSPDGRTLIFVRGKAGGGADLYAAERTTTPNGGAAWSEAFPLEGVNTTSADELGGVLSPDENTLFFYSDRAGGLGGYDLWRARRATDPLPSAAPDAEPAPSEDPAGVPPETARSAEAPARDRSLRGARWSEPENLGPAVNTPFNEYAPAPSPDAALLYFASNRPGPGDPVADLSRNWAATVREDQATRDYDLYAAPLTDRGPGEAERLDDLSTDANEGTPTLSPRGDFLYFASDRPGGAGGLDIYRVRLGLGEGTRGQIENLGWPINTPANELDPAITMEGLALHFSSDRGSAPAESAGGSTPPDAASGYAIYSTVSREVFRQREPLLAQINWWALWGAIWPWLLLLVLLAALTALMRRYLKDEQLRKRWRQLSLLAKCFVLSMMLHALLGALFTVWYVAGSVGEILGRPGGTRVALVSRGVGSDLASQIRGGLTDFSVRAEQVGDLRAAPVELSDLRPSGAELTAERTSISDRAIESDPEAVDARPQFTAPESRPASIESAPLADLSTPRAASPEQASEASLRMRAEAGSIPTTTAPVPATTPAGPRAVEVARGTVSDTTMSPLSRATTMDAPATTTSATGGASLSAPEIPTSAGVRTTAVPAPTSATVGVRERSLAIGATATDAGPAARPEVPGMTLGELSGRSTPALAVPSALPGDAPLSDAGRDAGEGASMSVPGPEAGGQLAGSLAIPTGDVAGAGQVRTPGVAEAPEPGSEASARSLAAEAVRSASVGERPSATLDFGAVEGSAPARVDLATPSGVAVERSIAAGGSGGVDAVDSRTSPSAVPGGADLTVPQIGGSSLSLATPGAGPAPQQAGTEALVTLGQEGRTVLEATRPALDISGSTPGASPLAALAPAARAGNGPTDASLAADSEGSSVGPLMTPNPTPGVGATGLEAIPLGVSSTTVPPTLALPSFTEEPAAPAEPLGVLAGVVTDADTGRPISGARVRLDLTEGPALVARSNVRGEYRLSVPEGIPDNVAISAVAPGYTPASINVSSDQIVRAGDRGGALARDFALRPLEWAVVPVEADPVVHHLGNDEFEGAINSQFQRSSEGTVYRSEFTLGADQVGRAIRAAELVLLAKGAQASNPIFINGRELDEYIVDTPRDGSFGELVFRISPRWLVEGVNTLEIRSVRGANDLDDFEFVNPRIRLRPTGTEPAPAR